MRPCIVAGNWKMNGTLESAQELADGIASSINTRTDALPRHVLAAVFPPSLFLLDIQSRLSPHGVLTGAQDCSEQIAGAYTGETSASMIRSVGASMVLVGHSERRSLYGDTLPRVSAKCQRAFESGLRPVLCIGENAAQRASGSTIPVLREQLVSVLDECTSEQRAGIIIAYEPVWAIGSGTAAEVPYIEEVHSSIRTMLREYGEELAIGTPILYGGSVTTSNAADIFSASDVDGALVGGASLRAESFVQLYRTAVDCIAGRSC